MSNAKHTPGPWEVRGRGLTEIGTRRHGRVAEVWFSDRERGKADAHLIAAAPELLAACEMIRDANQRTGDGVMISHETYADLLAAIAKAVCK